MNLDKCMKCSIPLNYCDGITRYKCGREMKDIEKYCVMEERRSL